MDDDDEAHSYPSPERGSHSPPPPSSGRITVKIVSAAASSPPPPHHNSLTLALPIQQPSSRPPAASAAVVGGREDCWSEGAMAALIEAWGEKYLQLSRGNLKQNHWNEVTDAVSRQSGNTKPPKTDAQCKNRIDTVKKKYKIEKAKAAAAGIPSRWPFFGRLDHLLCPSTATETAVPDRIPVGKRPSPASLPHHRFLTHCSTSFRVTSRKAPMWWSSSRRTLSIRSFFLLMITRPGFQITRGHLGPPNF